MPTSRTGSRKGITLLELLTVCVIVMLLSGLAAVAYVPVLKEARLRGATRLVLAAARYARSEAISTRSEMALSLDEQAGTVAVLRRAETTDTATTAPAWEADGTPEGRPRTLPDGISFGTVTRGAADTDGTADEATVIFYPTGQAQDCRITLVDSDKGQRTLAVDAITGTCEVVTDAAE